MEMLKLDYYLPPELIAQKPADDRSGSRMLVLNRFNGSIIDSNFTDICQYLRKDDCLVINNTKVIPARFFAQKNTGAKIEGLFLSIQDGKWSVMLKNSSKIKEKQTIFLLDRNKNQFCPAHIETKLEAGQWIIRPESELDTHEILEKIGFSPLPPYIKRPQPLDKHSLDSNRYQTVFARHKGAIAAPTAGLHFTAEILEKIKKMGISIAQITLHVGAGTFLPVKTKTLEEHEIHSEEYEINEENAGMINKTIQSGGRIIAVGTTAVRTLETAALETNARSIVPSKGYTKLFITPGFEFKITDAMITNFHLPKSTLLALIAAFAGLENVLNAYNHAVEQKYRFYSYGDCMLIH
ncbi:MAG: tRNA preQ1(34) S-adenosylmethionine ribosyltransferase-isomerase QueA [Planctomycetes bacterium GWF2_41_51]|nr:MAG: tRNA preQ1(34) S-adenosylmethionine ribosyltransferase-isomerase QueA [Planctomycetes bacterium GWF2_41_51]HBG25699.1 tRNA preQ1(34) S-adenosylmethionine ribosyltransferase-isomerase QueA [Phycisphaerales bacterium]